MSAGLNYAKAKRDRLARQAIHAGPDTASTSIRPERPLYGWRTEYPEQFPVTVRRIADADQQDTCAR